MNSEMARDRAALLLEVIKLKMNNTKCCVSMMPLHQQGTVLCYSLLYKCVKMGSTVDLLGMLYVSMVHGPCWEKSSKRVLR